MMPLLTPEQRAEYEANGVSFPRSDCSSTPHGHPRPPTHGSRSAAAHAVRARAGGVPAAGAGRAPRRLRRAAGELRPAGLREPAHRTRAGDQRLGGAGGAQGGAGHRRAPRAGVPRTRRAHEGGGGGPAGRGGVPLRGQAQLQTAAHRQQLPAASGAFASADGSPTLGSQRRVGVPRTARTGSSSRRGSRRRTSSSPSRCCWTTPRRRTAASAWSRRRTTG